MRASRLSILALPALLACQSFAQAPVPAGCDSKEARQFDFWLGDWALYYQGGSSFNRVTASHGGCVIQENFNGAPGSKLIGLSVSVFDRNANRWKQTWVDNTGAYLDFTGGFADGRMVLEREAEQAGKKFRQRMVFQDIAADSLKWLWQRSDDGGKSWETKWDIDYKRIK